jgi:hypothetical protein
MKTNGFLEGTDGGKSNSRLIADIIIVAALAFAEQVLISRGSESIILVATAASTIFITVGGSALAFLFVQKKTEVSTEAKELDKIMINK